MGVCRDGGEQTWILSLAFPSLQLLPIHLYQSPLLVLDIAPLSLSSYFPSPSFLSLLLGLKRKLWSPFLRSYLLLTELTSEELLWGLHLQNGQNLS